MINGEQSRTEAEKYLEKLIQKTTNVNERRKLFMQLENKYGISADKISDVFAFRKDIRELNNFEIFAILYFLDRNSLSKFFTQSEIEGLANEKQEIEPVSFPIVIKNMVQVANDQWVGGSSLLELMRLKDANLINYDENEQRVFRHIKKGNTTTYRISINNRAVEEIKELIEKDSYIPDTITLNMPEGSDYSYNDYTLTIHSLVNGKFNINDGYHRWLAMSSIHNFDATFDYPMELRIVNFATERAEQFIYQQDQKTVMKKVDSRTYNQYGTANKIMQRLNQNPLSNIQGMIGRNDAKINAGTFSALIDYFFVKPEKNQDTTFVIKTANDLQQKFNSLTDGMPELLKNNWSDRDMMIIIYLLSKDIIADYDIMDYLNEKLPSNGNLFYVAKTPRRKIINILDKAMEER